ncbi:amidase [Lepidopterella palustris CBS 459.81]|uniref:Amidase n=1 Tax=Lepidopterella palustris CBS 459.81 TaxID=1314670 RepID=A0A8E2E2H0_9PEZI|nr:amidase [Lepidopterella palustris CBS 459.81]
MGSRYMHTLAYEEDIKICIDGVHFLLVACQKNWLRNFALPQNEYSLSPLVVYSVSRGDRITKTCLENFRSNELKKDDIFQPQFLERIVFYGCQKDEVDIDEDAAEVLAKSWATTWTFMAVLESEERIPSGPYVYGRDMTWQPWRIYEDVNNTMMITFKPQTSGANELLGELDSVKCSNQLAAVVPSRCYFKKSKARPLNGERIVVKDVFDMKGFPTSLCNKAWRELYGPQKETAVSLQILVDKGAIIVGKARLNAMIVREETMECVEFLAPFNPRVDGYQTSSGSSSGSCAALGAYDWLDFAIGSDTNGSCRKPAHWNGCYAIRPTHGVLDTKGLVSFCPQFDVPAFFGRDLSEFPNFAQAWYGDSPLLKDAISLPKRLLYPLDYLPTSNKSQMRVVNSFVEDLVSVLGIKRTEYSLAEEWKKNRPEGVEEDDLAEYLRLVCRRSGLGLTWLMPAQAGTLPYYRDSYDALKDFRESYREKFGKTPFVHRALRWRWDVSKGVSDELRDELWGRIWTYKKWLLEHVLQVDQGPGTLLIYAIEDGSPNYRDAEPPPFELISGFHPFYISTIAGTPEVVAPVGEISHYSKISEREEPMPVSVAVLSAPGTDMLLIDVIKRAMEQGDRPTKLATGRSIYHSGGE